MGAGGGGGYYGGGGGSYSGSRKDPGCASGAGGGSSFTEGCYPEYIENTLYNILVDHGEVGTSNDVSRPGGYAILKAKKFISQEEGVLPYGTGSKGLVDGSDVVNGVNGVALYREYPNNEISKSPEPNTKQYYFPGRYTKTFSDDLDKAVVHVWGAGGAGSIATINLTIAPGGGGAYVNCEIALPKSRILNFIVGGGGRVGSTFGTISRDAYGGGGKSYSIGLYGANVGGGGGASIIERSNERAGLVAGGGGGGGLTTSPDQINGGGGGGRKGKGTNNFGEAGGTFVGENPTVNDVKGVDAVEVIGAGGGSGLNGGKSSTMSDGGPSASAIAIGGAGGGLSNMKICSNLVEPIYTPSESQVPGGTKEGSIYTSGFSRLKVGYGGFKDSYNNSDGKAGGIIFVYPGDEPPPTAEARTISSVSSDEL